MNTEQVLMERIASLEKEVKHLEYRLEKETEYLEVERDAQRAAFIRLLKRQEAAGREQEAFKWFWFVSFSLLLVVVLFTCS